MNASLNHQRTVVTPAWSQTQVFAPRTPQRRQTITATHLRPLVCAFMCVCAMTLAGCAPGDGVADVSLAELAASQQHWDGRDVRVRGVVRGFDDPRHYWLEDALVNRVGLLPPELIAPHLGREVTIVGRYTYARDRGRRITISRIDAFDDAR